MYLRDLDFRPSDFAGLSRDRAGDFYRQVGHVAEILLSFLPRRCFLADEAKFCIEFGPRRPGYPLVWEPPLMSYYVEPFDFDAYWSADLQAGDEMVLAGAERALLDIADRSGSDPAPLRAAVAATRDCRFNRSYEISKLSRLSPSRRLMVRVYRNLWRGHETWDARIESRAGELLEVRSITGATDGYRSAHDYKRSEWKGNVFFLRSYRLGRPTFRINVAPIERKLRAAKPPRGRSPRTA